MSGKCLYEFSIDANQDGVFNEADGDEKYISYELFGASDLLTSNTNANDPDSVFISDKLAPASFRWPFVFHAPVDVASLTFKPAPKSTTRTRRRPSKPSLARSPTICGSPPPNP